MRKTGRQNEKYWEEKMIKSGRRGGRNSVKKELADCGCEEERKDPTQFAQALLASLVTSAMAARKQLDFIEKNNTKQNNNNNNNIIIKNAVDALCESSLVDFLGILGLFTNNPVYNLFLKYPCSFRPSSSKNNNVATQERDKTLFKRSLPDDLLDNLPFIDESEDEEEGAGYDDSLQCFPVEDPCDEIALEDCLATSNDEITTEDLRIAPTTESQMVWCSVCQRILQGHPIRDDEDVLSHLSERRVNEENGEHELVHADPSTAFEYIQFNPDYPIFQRPFGIIYWRQENYGPDPTCDDDDDGDDDDDDEPPPDTWDVGPVGPRIDWNNSIHELGAAALPFDDGLDENNNNIHHEFNRNQYPDVVIDDFTNGQQPPPPWANYTDQVLLDVIPRCLDCLRPEHGNSDLEQEKCRDAQDVIRRGVSHSTGQTHPLDLADGTNIIQRDTNGGGYLYRECFAPLF